jgi:hypothetical protein
MDVNAAHVGASLVAILHTCALRRHRFAVLWHRYSGSCRRSAPPDGIALSTRPSLAARRRLVGGIGCARQPGKPIAKLDQGHAATARIAQPGLEIEDFFEQPRLVVIVRRARARASS